MIVYVRKSKSTTGLLHHLSKQTVCTPIGAKQYLLGEIPKTLCKKTTPKKIEKGALGTMTKYEIPIESKKKRSARIPIDKLHDFDGHPFKVTDNEDMDKLVESIKSQGIISPLIVRLKDNATDEY